MSEEEKKRRLQINLNNDVLMTNCGVPIVFVVNKTDDPLQKNEHDIDFILRHIRKSAINYGATVVYTSTKTSSNIQILYDYILYSLFNYDLVHKPNMIEKNAFFIPSGYDRMSILKNNDTQKDLDFDFLDKIKEEKEEIKVEDEIECEKSSEFLKKVKDRVYRSRKSFIRNDLMFGKSLVPGLNSNEIKKKDTIDKDRENKEKEKPAAEKVNKFQKFLEKKDIKASHNDTKKEKLNDEERQKATRESLLNKLKLNKNKK